VKPDPAIYTHAVAAMGAEPGEVTFVDDKEVNVDGAVRAGLRGVVFRGVDQLRRDLG
jgi:putative hydrolase of the HAD superfamily